MPYRSSARQRCGTFFRVRAHLVVFVSAFFSTVVGCTTSTLPQNLPPEEQEAKLGGKRTGVHYAGSQNAPEISKSVGQEGGVVVLWPRIVPRSEEADLKEIASLAQGRLAALATELGAEVDRRPEPERVCPRPDGCRAVTVSAVVTKKQSGCALVATVAKPGASPTTLVPWVGKVDLAKPSVPFREPPESEITVAEFSSCEKLKQDLSSNAAPADEAALRAALKAALGK